jgi:hypothetical protein
MRDWGFPKEFEKVSRYTTLATSYANVVTFIANNVDNYNMIAFKSNFPPSPSRAGEYTVVSNYSEAALRADARVHTHELGHCFGLLDEYMNWGYPSSIPANCANLDTTSDLSKIRWSHFIGLKGYELVGAYEGAFEGYGSGVWPPYDGPRFKDGVYRPYLSSIMDKYYSARSIPHPSHHFNAPSREAIVKGILKAAGEPYTFEKFLEKDVPIGF